ncbi:MAG: zinc-binding dehydrogenase, partial [Pseudomonadota bacterium]
VSLAEPHPARRATAAAAAGAEPLDPDEDAGRGGGGALPQDVDLVIDGVGIDATRRAASAAVRPGGVIMHIGLGAGSGGLDVRRMTLQEIAFIGTYTYTAQDFRDTAAAIFDGRLGALDWAEERALAEGAGAFDDIAAGRAAAPKIVLTP